MAVTMEQVVRYLQPDEVNYSAAAQMGPDALPHLITLVNSPDPDLASKAASLAGFIGSDRASEVLRIALGHREPIVRVAAAAAIGNLPSQTMETLLEVALRDEDTGVRRIAVDLSAERLTPNLHAVLENLAENDPEPGLRRMSNKVLQRRE